MAEHETKVIEATAWQTVLSVMSGCHGHNSWQLDGENVGRHDLASIALGRIVPEGTRIRVTVEVLEEPDEPLRTNPWHDRKYNRPDGCVCPMREEDDDGRDA